MSRYTYVLFCNIPFYFIKIYRKKFHFILIESLKHWKIYFCGNLTLQDLLDINLRRENFFKKPIIKNMFETFFFKNSFQEKNFLKFKTLRFFFFWKITLKNFFLLSEDEILVICSVKYPLARNNINFHISIRIPFGIFLLLCLIVVKVTS